jgi:hypothetical protein
MNKSEDAGPFTRKPRARVTKKKPLARFVAGDGRVRVLPSVILARLLCLARKESRLLALKRK